MMMRLIMAIFLFSIPVSANAEQTLPVRAGEHGEYSRLVIPNAPDDWRIATSNRKIEIAFSNKDFAFDLSDITEKRKAHRVLSANVLDAGDTRALVLSLTCDCPVRTSKSAENSIIIDIFNEQPGDVSEATVVSDAQTPAPDAQSAERTPATPENMRVARDRMIALLAEARHQGVVQLKIDETRSVDTQPQTPSESAPTQTAATPVTQASTTPTELMPLRDEPTTFDQPEPVVEQTSMPTMTEQEDIRTAQCVDQTLFAEPTQEEGKLDYATITNLRQLQEQTEDEDEKRDIAKTLALAYLHIGFFDEASAIARSRSSDDENMAVVYAIAELASGNTLTARTSIAPFQACGAFFEMIHAASSGPDDTGVASLMHKHIDALKSLASPMRAPIAEKLALYALDNGDKGIAEAAYRVAKDARQGERTAALAILEKSFATAPGVRDIAKKELVEIAQTPGPLQGKALAVLADEYAERADTAYEGFLDDLAGQASASSTADDSRAAFSGAKALANAGRLQQGIAVLENATSNSPTAKPAGQELARSLIINALNGDAENRLNGVDAFLKYQAFVDDRENGDVNIAVATELAALGAPEFVDRVIAEAPSAWRAQAAAAKAKALLNKGDANAALEIALRDDTNPEFLSLAANAYERLNDQVGTKATIKSAIQQKTVTDEMTRAAWRTSDWALTRKAFDTVEKDLRTESAAARTALSALNSGATTVPKNVRETLKKQPELLAALAHMFEKAPPVNIRAIDLLDGFSRGVTKETDLMQKGVGNE